VTEGTHETRGSESTNSEVLVLKDKLRKLEEENLKLKRRLREVEEAKEMAVSADEGKDEEESKEEPAALKESFFMARVCLQCQMFDDMEGYLDRIIEEKQEPLSDEDQSLISQAFKGKVEPLRQAIEAIVGLKENSQYEQQKLLLEKYLLKLKAKRN